MREAQAAGAVGFVGVLKDYFDSNRYHNEYHRKLTMTIPGMGSPEPTGHECGKLLARHGNRSRIDLTVHRRAVVGRTVFGFLLREQEGHRDGPVASRLGRYRRC